MAEESDNLQNEPGETESLDNGSQDQIETFSEARSPEEMMSAFIKSRDTGQPTEKEGEASTDSDPESEDGPDTNKKKDTEDEAITAKGEGVATKPEEKAAKGKWSEEDLKYFESKGWDPNDSESFVSNLNKSYRDAEKRIQESGETIGTLNSRLGSIANMLLAGDVQGIQEIAKHLGAELPIETRTHEDRLREHEEAAQEIQGSFEPLIQDIAKQAKNLFNQPGELSAAEVGNFLNEITEALRGNVSRLSSKHVNNINEIKQNILLDKKVNSRMGLPEKASYYDTLAAEAKNRFTDIRNADKNADEYLTKAQELFGPGSAFEAAGINVAKVFGFSQDTALQAVKIGKGLAALEKIESGELKKQHYEQFQKEQAGRIGHVPSGANQLGKNEPEKLSPFDKARLQHYQSTY